MNANVLINAQTVDMESGTRVVRAPFRRTCTNIYALVRSASMSAKVIGCSLLLILLLMFFVFRAIKSPRVVNAAEEALIVTIPLRSGDMGDAE